MSTVSSAGQAVKTVLMDTATLTVTLDDVKPGDWVKVMAIAWRKHWLDSAHVGGVVLFGVGFGYRQRFALSCDDCRRVCCEGCAHLATEWSSSVQSVSCTVLCVGFRPSRDDQCQSNQHCLALYRSVGLHTVLLLCDVCALCSTYFQPFVVCVCIYIYMHTHT